MCSERLVLALVISTRAGVKPFEMMETMMFVVTTGIQCLSV